MDAQKAVKLHTEADLRTHAVSILRRINSDERSGLLFLLNPVFALEEAGFDLSANMRQHLLRGLRYGPRTKARIREIEAEVTEAAGRPINVEADAQVRRLLFTDLKLARPEVPHAPATAPRAAPAQQAQAGSDEPATSQQAGGVALDHELEALQQAHPLVPKIVELRGLLRGGWRFVDRDAYERVKNGATVTLLRGVRFKADRSKAFLSSFSEGDR